jgi:hypothetical protein
MSIYIALLIMILTGVLGGIINYLLAGGPNDSKKTKLPNSIVIGIGATLLVPLFLQIAQSKILENLHDGWTKEEAKTDPLKNPAAVYRYIDTTKQKKDTILLAALQKDNNAASKPVPPSNNPFQNYFLFIAYCLLASTAGSRFINMLIDGVIKGEKLTQLESENKTLEKDIKKRTANSQLSQQQEHEKVKEQLIGENKTELEKNVMLDSGMSHTALPILPELPPVTHPDDPQKGRFGGKAKNNFRELKGEVTSSSTLNFYRVKIWVESTDPQNYPLNSDVIFYIHDSFSPSVFTYKPNEFKNGMAIENGILSYGAFTVGVITDNGKTLLELDLVDVPGAPKQFKER